MFPLELFANFCNTVAKIVTFLQIIERESCNNSRLSIGAKLKKRKLHQRCSLLSLYKMWKSHKTYLRYLALSGLVSQLHEHTALSYFDLFGDVGSNFSNWGWILKLEKDRLKALK